jgi:hypothetical protein
MSHTTIPLQVKLKTWLAAGGRCEYRGCNEPLWKDTLTLARMNRAYLAHIVADTPGGPRGDPVMSDLLKADPSNIILLCDMHHRLIDTEKVEEHPVELLREYKQQHEERIERLTALQANVRTEILLFGTRIQDRRGAVNFEDACDAVLPDRYPADERGIRIDLAEVNVSDGDDNFWDLVKLHVDRETNRYLGDSRGPSGKPINHLSIFALAPIPALVYLGMKLGDIVAADVYQRHRNPASWKWQVLEDENFHYITNDLVRPQANTSSIVVNLSLSGWIDQNMIDKFMGAEVPTYSITIAHPHRDFLQAKEQLELFLVEWYGLLSKLKKTYESATEIHLFAAVPNAVAVEIGRSLLTVDPVLIVYNATDTGFERALVMKRKSRETE